MKNRAQHLQSFLAGNLLVFYRAFQDFHDSSLPQGIGETEKVALKTQSRLSCSQIPNFELPDIISEKNPLALLRDFCRTLVVPSEAVEPAADQAAEQAVDQVHGMAVLLRSRKSHSQNPRKQ